MARGSTAPEAVLEGAEVGGAGHVRNDAVRRGWAGGGGGDQPHVDAQAEGQASAWP